MPGVPFDEDRGIIPNEEGRIVGDGGAVKGLYAAGWIKRGPSGIIGTNKPDSQATVAALLEDAEALVPCEIRDSAPLLDLLNERGLRVVSFEDWKKIDQAEVQRGQKKGKPREKFPSTGEMLAALD